MYLASAPLYLSFFPVGDLVYELQKIKKEIEIDGFHTIYYFEFGKHFSHTPEKHDFWELVYVDSGEIIAVTDGVKNSLSCGQVVFHEPDEVHAHLSNELVPNNMLIISFSTKSEAMSYFKKRTFTLDKQLKTLLSLFINEVENSIGNLPNKYDISAGIKFDDAPVGTAQLLECYLTEFLIKLIRKGRQNDKKDFSASENRTISDNSIIELMKKYMQDKIYENITLKDMCAHFMLGKSQLSKIFKENSGKSPYAYYTSLRISEAKKLLREGNLSVSEISEKLGYTDIYGFSRAFKRSVGLSPMAYKQSVL